MNTAFRYCPHCAAVLAAANTANRPHQACNHCDTVHYRNPTVGVAVVLFEQDKILLVRRKGSMAGRWCIPCGHVDWHEDIRSAARRELYEETGLFADIGPVFEALSNTHNPDRYTAGIWFWGTRTDGTLRAGSDAENVGFFACSTCRSQWPSLPILQSVTNFGACTLQANCSAGLHFVRFI